MNLDNLTQSASTLEQAHEIIGEMVALLKAQQLEIESLKAQVADLQNQQGRSSRNSSKPPSSDSPQQRHQRPRKPKSSRSKGAQPGHIKHERTMIDEQDVDQVHRYFPESHCPCGGFVHHSSEPHLRHQVFDLPEVRYTVTEHQIYSGCCQRCGQITIADSPDWVPSGQMDAGLISTIVLLSGQFHLSIRQIHAFLKEQWQLDFSLGAISQAQGKANPWLGSLYQQIGEAARASEVAHADETRHFRGTEQRWLWTLVTEHLCYFMVHYSRGKAANIGQRLLLISHLVFRTHHRFLQSGMKRSIYERGMKRLRDSFGRTLISGSQLTLAKRTANQCRHLLKDEAMCWTFLQHPDIPLTNNSAERAIRPYVIWRKLSFASQSHQGDQFRPMILTVIGTAHRLGLSTAKLLRQMCAEGLHQGEVSMHLPLSKALKTPN